MKWGVNSTTASSKAPKSPAPDRPAAPASTLPNTAYRSGAKILPPFIYAVVFGVGVLLQRWLAAAALPRSAGQWVTLLCMSISATLAVWSFFSFWRARTSALPIQPSAALVTTGPYRFIRNPMYVSLAFLYVGLAFWYDVFWALILLPAAIALVQHLVLPGEERYLEQRFENEYRRYKARVPRWLPRLRRYGKSQ